MRVLVACEYSGRVRDAFTRMGHDATSCDILPSDMPGKHYQGDVFDILHDDWDLMVAHPPCTYLSNSGVTWLHRQADRMAKMIEGAKFFKALLDAPIPLKAIENPIMHKYAVEVIGRRQDQVIQPYMFGHLEQKATCLWLEGLPLLVPTTDLKAETLALPDSERQRIHYMPPGKDRQKMRSLTFQGIADAMAKQWSDSVSESRTP